MPTSAGNIAKGEILRKFDEYINGPYNSFDEKTRKEYATKVRVELEGGRELVDVIDEVGIPLSQDQKDHLGHDWLDEAHPDGTKSGWWQYLQPLDPVLRQGFIESAKAVESKGHRVDHYWISAGNVLEMWVCEGPDQITTIIATPTPPSGLGAVSSEHDQIRIVRPVAVPGLETVEGGVLLQGNSVVVVLPRRGL